MFGDGRTMNLKTFDCLCEQTSSNTHTTKKVIWLWMVKEWEGQGETEG